MTNGAKDFLACKFKEIAPNGKAGFIRDEVGKIVSMNDLQSVNKRSNNTRLTGAEAFINTIDLSGGTDKEEAFIDMTIDSSVDVDNDDEVTLIGVATTNVNNNDDDTAVAKFKNMKKFSIQEAQKASNSDSPSAKKRKSEHLKNFCCFQKAEKDGTESQTMELVTEWGNKKTVSELKTPEAYAIWQDIYDDNDEE
mmetsp:Transcript_5377/g.6060  ORF Transcript_5377/g.6060 Transcript_5377/m.6060 type:complete len:195 (+) Transcript_5377:236-820(+)